MQQLLCTLRAASVTPEAVTAAFPFLAKVFDNIPEHLLEKEPSKWRELRERCATAGVMTTALEVALKYTDSAEVWKSFTSLCAAYYRKCTLDDAASMNSREFDRLQLTKHIFTIVPTLMCDYWGQKGERTRGGEKRGEGEIGTCCCCCCCFVFHVLSTVVVTAMHLLILYVLSFCFSSFFFYVHIMFPYLSFFHALTPFSLCLSPFLTEAATCYSHSCCCRRHRCDGIRVDCHCHNRRTFLSFQPRRRS